MQHHDLPDGAEVPLVSLPGYMEWSERRLGAGESPVLIANLDAQTITIRPGEMAELDESYFDGILDNLREQRA
jgi:hypothetical protein